MNDSIAYTSLDIFHVKVSFVNKQVTVSLQKNCFVTKLNQLQQIVCVHKRNKARHICERPIRTKVKQYPTNKHKNIQTLTLTSFIHILDSIKFLIHLFALMLQPQVGVYVTSRSTLICEGYTCNAAPRGKPQALNSSSKDSNTHSHTFTFEKKKNLRVRYSLPVSFKDAWGRLGGQNHTVSLSLCLGRAALLMQTENLFQRDYRHKVSRTHTLILTQA